MSASSSDDGWDIERMMRLIKVLRSTQEFFCGYYVSIMCGRYAGVQGYVVGINDGLLTVRLHNHTATAYSDIVVPSEYAIIGSMSPDDLIREAVGPESEEESLPATSSSSSSSEEKKTSSSSSSGVDDDDDEESSKESSEESSKESSEESSAPKPKKKKADVLEASIPLAVSVPTTMATERTIDYFSLGPLEEDMKVFAKRIVASNLDNQMDVVTSILRIEVAHQRLSNLRKGD